MVAASACRVTATAHAKINLFLHLTGRRDDGYHLIDSVFLFTDLADRIEAVPASALSLEMTGPEAVHIADETPDNLVLRAARRLAQVADRPPQAHLLLEKRIPVAAGLGGGSADAAATLRVLDRLWGLGLDESRLAAIALELGADVPACLYGRPLRAGGIGERVQPLDGAPEWGILLVNPGIALSTAHVFAGFRHRSTRWRPPLAGEIPWRDAGWLAGETANDLEEPACGLAPSIRDVLKELRATTGCRLARMSGSGATCFALYDGPAAARIAAEDLARDHPDWWIHAGAPAGFLPHDAAA